MFDQKGDEKEWYGIVIAPIRLSRKIVKSKGMVLLMTSYIWPEGFEKEPEAMVAVMIVICLTKRVVRREGVVLLMATCV